jgi:hypothetical protein
MERTGSQFLQCALSVTFWLIIAGFAVQILAKVLAVLMVSFFRYTYSITQSLLTFKKAATAFVFNLSDFLVTYPTI